MCYVPELFPKKIKSFKQFLNEVNFGALEKDNRILEVTERLKNDMLDNIDDKKLFGKIQIGLSKKSKNPNILQYILNWEFVIYKDNGEHEICSGASFDRDIKGNNLVLFIFWDQNKTSNQFKDELYRFIKGYKSNEFIRHEVKHFLDTIVDGKFSNDVYHTLQKDNITAFDKTKYISQHSEIESFLVSVLSDLERIKKENDSIRFDQAIDESNVYKAFMEHIIPSKRNKYKTKIIYFWFSNFEKGKL